MSPSGRHGFIIGLYLSLQADWIALRDALVANGSLSLEDLEAARLDDHALSEWKDGRFLEVLAEMRQAAKKEAQRDASPED